MRYVNICSITLFSLFLLFRWAPDSDARAFRIAKLPGAGPNFGCAACHVNPGGGGERNAFGLDYEAIVLAAGDVYTDELGQKDSDGDGFSNDEEFNADPPTEPWNRDSHPPNVAVEPLGKAIAIWARLKLEPIGFSRNYDSRSANTVLEPSTALKPGPKPVHQKDPAAVTGKPATIKNQRQPEIEPLAAKNRKTLKVRQDAARGIRKE
jgi:hypothetical protein